MYLAHAGHEHMSELPNIWQSTEFIVGVVMLTAAVIVIGYLVYDALKGRKPKSKKKR